MPHPETELWSLVAVCNRCGGRTVIFTNVPERLSSVQGNYSVTCTGCNHHGLFRIDRVGADTVEAGGGVKEAATNVRF